MCRCLDPRGGIAGGHAGIKVAKRGMKVVIIDKGAVMKSGSGGTGVDLSITPRTEQKIRKVKKKRVIIDEVEN